MSYLTVAGLAFVEFWLAYPAAYALNMGWLEATLVIGVSSSVGAVLAIQICGLFRDWVMGRFQREGFIAKRTKPFMARYGTVGLGLLAPWILGPILTSIGALVLGADVRRLSLWVVIGIWVWAVGVYLAIHLTGSIAFLLPGNGG